MANALTRQPRHNMAGHGSKVDLEEQNDVFIVICWCQGRILYDAENYNICILSTDFTLKKCVTLSLIKMYTEKRNE
jgi:hypothetical protein